MPAGLVVPYRNEGQRVVDLAYQSRDSLEQGVITEAIFVDNGSTDGAPEQLAKLGWLTLGSTEGQRGGKAKALDVGIITAQSKDCDIFVLADGDMHGVTPVVISQLKEPINDGAAMVIGYLGWRKPFANLPYPFNHVGALSGLRAVTAEAWGTLSDGWFDNRSDKKGFNEPVLNGHVAKLGLPIAREPIDGVGHVSKFKKTGRVLSPVIDYAANVIHVTRASLWIAIEPEDKELGLEDKSIERLTNTDQLIRAQGAHRRLRNVWGVTAVSAELLSTLVSRGDLYHNPDLALASSILAMGGFAIGACNEYRRKEYDSLARGRLNLG